MCRRRAASFTLGILGPFTFCLTRSRTLLSDISLETRVDEHPPVCLVRRRALPTVDAGTVHGAVTDGSPRAGPSGSGVPAPEFLQRAKFPPNRGYFPVAKYPKC